MEYITRSGDAADNDEANPAADHLAKNFIPPEETMKIRLLLALLGSAIGIALPTFAQEQNTVDPEVRQQIEALFMKFGEAFNKHDPAAIAALYAQNAIRSESWWSEVALGQQSIEKS